MTDQPTRDKDDRLSTGRRSDRWRRRSERWRKHRVWRESSIGSTEYRSRRRTMFGRFIGFLFFLALPLVGLGILLGWLIAGSEAAAPRLTVVLMVICGIPLLIAMLVGLFGVIAFRSMGTPLAKIMTAADAVAEGDLSTRVEESGSREFKRMAHSFNRMASELERADQQRRNLTADVAHELRTPLHILQGNLEGLQDGVYQATPEHIEAMLDETRMLSRLVDDLQILSLAEAGQLTLHMEPFPIKELLCDVSTGFSGPAEESGVDLHVELAGNGDEMIITGDVERLDQVLSNLVANALRHTPSGGCILLKAAPNPSGVMITVRDTGKGIPAEDIPYVFDRFWRGDRARGRSAGTGSGLGLAISKQLVQAHGGQISVESQPGVETSFTIVLPENQD